MVIHSAANQIGECRAERVADTRYRIERAALEHFVKQGVAATSIREIADTAGTSLGAMYNHFESKEQLAWHLFITGWVEFGRELLKRAREHKKLSEQLRAMIRYVFRRFDEDWLLVTYVFVSRHLHLKRVPSMRDNPYLIFRIVIGEAMRRREIEDGDLELKTSLVIGAVIQTTDSRILGRLDGTLEGYADQTVALCLRLLRA
jgi:AcrR family transcriptional regulator